MKILKIKITLLITLILIAAGLFAIPLSVLIVQESEKIADSIRAFNKECAGVDDTSQRYTECFKKRGDIGRELSGFVMLVQQETNLLGDPAEERTRLQEQQATLSESQKAEITKQWGTDALDIEAELKHSDARRHDMKLQIRWATYYFACLGREDASECKAEKAALDKEEYPFGRVGLMSQDPTHVGEEEAKHWHPMKVISVIKSGQGLPALVGEEDAVGIIEDFVKALASNDLNRQLGYYADRVDYYDFGQVTKQIVRKDLEHDIARWPDRTYSITSPPKITPDNSGLDNNGFIAEFPMRYTLTSPKGTSSGTLQMTVRLKPQAQNWQVVGIQKKAIQAARER
jgi:hypothetical protein